MTRRLLVSLLLWLLPVSIHGQSQAASSGVKPLTILHSNDLHAHLLPNDDGRGGFARLATAVRQERARCEACLYLNAGDLVQGTPVSTLFHGTPVYEIANLLGIDVSTLGNHEFDYGWRRTQEFVRTAKFPIVSANVLERGEPATGRAYVIKTVGGIRVGIIGAVLGDMVGNVVTTENVGPWKVLPVVETVRKYAAELRDRTDLLVVLGHIHDKSEVEAILHEVPEVAVVVAGHTHTGYPSMMNVDGRVAVLVNSYGTELGRLDLKVDPQEHKAVSAEWKKIPIDARYAPAPEVARAVGAWESKVSKLVDVPIGESTRKMPADDVRSLVERVMKEVTGADIGWTNSGNIRETLPKGQLLARHIWNILPFDNTIVTGKFKGSELPRAITDRYPVDPDREYTVAVTDFTAMNQSSTDQLETTGLKFPHSGPLQRDAVIEWVKKHKVVP